ncbi:hypothetical protein GCM10020366_63540 [Saccharopolyspora gregorii]|uniref:Uncharacterized protein n=1 Tax=Saccharopolyspora gregorii TaxID=33914 RepID=A0ABP6S0T0_9PSEU
MALAWLRTTPHDADHIGALPTPANPPVADTPAPLAAPATGRGGPPAGEGPVRANGIGRTAATPMRHAGRRRPGPARPPGSRRPRAGDQRSERRKARHRCGEKDSTPCRGAFESRTATTPGAVPTSTQLLSSPL